MTPEKLSDTVNGSGYLLQIDVAERVRRMSKGWEVAAEEHPWERDGEPRFIDLVLAQDAQRLVTECKRPGGGEYVFLVRKDAGVARSARCRWMEYVPRDDNRPDVQQGWFDFGSTSATYETQYALLPGREDGRKPILERLAAEAVEACDALAAEEFSIAYENGRRLRRIYVPTIVTTAPLYVVHYDPANIDPKTATLTGEIAAQEVDVLWFRKSLTTVTSEGVKPENLRSANADRERSVLVIGASNLEATLLSLNLVGSPLH